MGRGREDAIRLRRALLAAALAAGALRASWPAMKREAPASFLLGAIGMTLCGAAAYLAGEHHADCVV